MSTFDTAVANVLERIAPLESLEVPLLEAAGCSTTHAVVAKADVPALPTAAHDGYCVRLEDLADASTSTPVVLPVVGDVSPGEPPVVTVQPGFCARIWAGAAVPIGTDAVVPTDATDAGVARVAITTRPSDGDGIVATGSLMRAGEVLIPAHERLRPAHLGLLAAAGLDRVAVSPRPRVVVVPIGTELQEPGQGLLPGQWSESAGPLVTSVLRDAGALAFRVAPLPANVRSVIDTVEDQLVRADLVVMVDARGAAARSVVRDVLHRLGEVEFQEVPAEPVGLIGAGTVGPDATPVIVVPNDAAAAYVATELIARPMVRRMLGLTPVHRPVVRALFKGEVQTDPARRSYLPADLDVADGVYVVHPLTHAGHGLFNASAASAFVVVPEGVGICEDGRTVEVVVLERRHA